MADKLTDGDSIPIQYRELEIHRDGINEEARTVDISFSSEDPAKRYYGTEILEHGSKSNARMTRINQGAPLLWNHDPSDQRGVVDKAYIDPETKRGQAVVRYSKSVKGQELFQDVLDGITRSISFGYRIHGVTETKGEADEGNVVRVTDWEPYEISHVSIPMDHTVGVGRANDNETNIVAVRTADKQPTKQIIQNTKDMSEPIKPDSAAEPEVQTGTETRNGSPAIIKSDSQSHAEVRQAEKKRQSTITKVGAKFGFANAARDAIDSDMSAEDFRASVTDNWQAPTAEMDVAGLNKDVGLSPKEVREFSILKAIEDIKEHGRLDGLERDASAEAARHLGVSLGSKEFIIPAELGKRAASAGTDSAGGYLVEDTHGSLIEKLDAATVANQLNIIRLTGLVGDMPMNKVTGGGTASWIGEGDTATDATMAFGQVWLRPKRLVNRSIINDQLLIQTRGVAENIYRNDAMTREALKLDDAFFNGSGTGSEPLGVNKQTGIGSITFGGAQTYQDWVDLWNAVATDNALSGALAYVTSSNVIAKGLTTAIESGDSAKIINGGVTGGFGVIGLPILMLNQALDIADQVLFGSWNNAMLATWGARKVIVDDVTLAAQGQLVITQSSFHDCNVRHVESFSASTDTGAA